MVASVAQEGHLVERYDPAALEEWQRLVELSSFPEFPAWVLDPGTEPLDAVVAATDLPYYRLSEFLEPPDMLDLAAEFECCAAEFRAKAGQLDEDAEHSIVVIRTAADWLRFWAERGHPSKGCWFIQTPRGRIQVEVG